MKNNLQDACLLNWLDNIIPDSEVKRLKKGFDESPTRITKGYQELLNGYNIKDAGEILKVTEEIPGCDYSGLVSVQNVDFFSMCEHHFLPFIGKIDLIYEPGPVILGIGKLSRLVDYRANRFNIQESIARQLCEDLMKFGKAKGAFARVTAKHMCCCYRGPAKYNALNTVIYHQGTCSSHDKINEIKTILSI